MIRSLVVFISFLSLASYTSCKKGSETASKPTGGPFYFPPGSGNEWQTVSASSLGWNETELSSLSSYLQSKKTKAFIILKNGKIVSEQYFGTFTADSLWYWASAGKTMTALMVGIAQQEGMLNINNRSSQYLGTGWTSAPLEKENLITVKHQLTMTTGLDETVSNDDCTLPGCLQYKADAGTRWAYHNAPYTILDRVVENATGIAFNTYFQQKIKDKIGMSGSWRRLPSYNNVFFSNARSMARFGLLMLSKGKWGNTTVLHDTTFFNAQVSTSQNLNLSYGYLTWLNGKGSYMLPEVRTVFNGPMIPNAPADMYAALGKDDQKIYVVPSLNVVVIRMGEAAGMSKYSLSSFDNELWGKLKVIMKY